MKISITDINYMKVIFMKSITLKRILSALLAAAMCFSLASCGYEELMTNESEEFYLTKDAELSEADKAGLEEIQTYFESFIADADPQLIRNYLDASFEATDEQLSQFISTFSGETFELYDTYYINDIKPDTVARRFKKTPDAQESVELTPAVSEMYLALYKSDEEKISHMLSLLCAKDGGDWKIVWIDATDLAYNGRNASALYAKASELKDSSFLSSYVYSLLLSLTMRPGNALIYKDHQIFEDFYYQTATEFQKNYPMPYTPDGIENSIKIHTIALANEGGEILPLIVMQTATPITDEAALRDEAEDVLDALEEKSPGFTDEFNAVAFNAVNEDPTVEGAQPEAKNFVITQN